MRRNVHFLWIAGALLLSAMGCKGPVIRFDVETAVREDQSVRRQVSIRAGVPQGVPESAAKAMIGRSLRLPAEDRYQLYEAAGNRIRMEGTFASAREVPVDFTKTTPGSQEWSQNRLKVVCRDYVLFKVIDYEERIDDIVERLEAEEALQESMTLLLDTLLPALEARYGKDYDLSLLTAYLRQTLPELADRLYQGAWEIRRARRGAAAAGPWERHEWEVRLLREFTRLGVTLEPFSSKEARKRNEEALWAFLDQKLQTLVVPRRKDTPPLTAKIFRSREQQKELVRHLEASVKERFGSLGGLLQKLDPLFPAVSGAFFTKRPVLLQSAPTFHFNYRTRLPGQVIQSNATRDLDGSLFWRFESAQVMLTGYRMWARTVVTDKAASARLNLSSFPGSLETVERFHRALHGQGRPDPKMVTLLRRCVAQGALTPLQEAAIPGRAQNELSAAAARRLLGIISAFYRPSTTERGAGEVGTETSTSEEQSPVVKRADQPSAKKASEESTLEPALEEMREKGITGPGRTVGSAEEKHPSAALGRHGRSELTGSGSQKPGQVEPEMEIE